MPCFRPFFDIAVVAEVLALSILQTIESVAALRHSAPVIYSFNTDRETAAPDPNRLYRSEDGGGVYLSQNIPKGRVVVDKNEEGLDHRFQRIENELPNFGARSLRWLREPSSRWVRIPAGILLMLTGLFGFLPVLGFWMLPLGLLLLVQDISFLRSPTERTLAWLERRWVAFKRRLQSRQR